MTDETGEKPARTRDESFQFWYRAIVLCLLPIILGAVSEDIHLQWSQSIAVAEVQSDVQQIRASLADLPRMKTDVELLKVQQADAARRLDVLENNRELRRNP